MEGWLRYSPCAAPARCQAVRPCVCLRRRRPLPRADSHCRRNEWRPTSSRIGALRRVRGVAPGVALLVYVAQLKGPDGLLWITWAQAAISAVPAYPGVPRRTPVYIPHSTDPNSARLCLFRIGGNSPPTLRRHPQAKRACAASIVCVRTHAGVCPRV
jgi:hypothetical protein